MKISFYPNTIFEWSNPLWKVLKDALAKHNVEVVNMPFSLFALLKNRGKVKIIHFHYVYPDIAPGRYSCLPKRIWNRAYRIATAYQNKTFAMRLKIAKLLGYGIVYTVHNLNFHERIAPDTARNLELMYKSADRIIVMGKDTRRELTERTGKNNISLIPPFHLEGVYKNVITKEAARSKLNIPHDAFVYLFFGNIRPYKGVDILVRTFKKMGLETILLIAGDTSLDPPYVDKLKDLIGGDRRVLMKESMEPDDIQVFMNAADIVVFPFRQITNSASVMLAKAFYRPTICMDKGNTKDYANPLTDVLVKNEAELEKALIEARRRPFHADKKEYLKGIPDAGKAAELHKNLYKRLR